MACSSDGDAATLDASPPDAAHTPASTRTTMCPPRTVRLAGGSSLSRIDARSIERTGPAGAAHGGATGAPRPRSLVLELFATPGCPSLRPRSGKAAVYYLWFRHHS